MGYRSTLITDETGVEFSKQFIKIWCNEYNFGHGIRHTPISSKYEKQGHSLFIKDIHEYLKEVDHPHPILACILWEDGKIDRYHISRDGYEVENIN